MCNSLNITRQLHIPVAYKFDFKSFCLGTVYIKVCTFDCLACISKQLDTNVANLNIYRPKGPHHTITFFFFLYSLW